ncbi:hypothetical protein BpHYR1_011936 [Brachionus plicatilis]|uniref:Uncharacterized protein n=1 Tax=Brachionus plicatilis TaxID=10195 RepID=A0A3M7SMN3_BRAPC|nr:hypothetical protein BpHYR1_011936 [Brachionus plicatilis]
MFKIPLYFFLCIAFLWFADPFEISVARLGRPERVLRVLGAVRKSLGLQVDVVAGGGRRMHHLVPVLHTKTCRVELTGLDQGAFAGAFGRFFVVGGQDFVDQVVGHSSAQLLVIETPRHCLLVLEFDFFPPN